MTHISSPAKLGVAMGQAWLVTIPSSGDSNDNLLTAPSSPGDGSALRSQGQDARECLGADAKQASWKGRQAALPGARTCAAFGPKLCAPPPLPTPCPATAVRRGPRWASSGGHSGPAARRLGRQGLSPEAGHTGQLLSHTCWYFNTHGERPTDRAGPRGSAESAAGKWGPPGLGRPANSPD